MLRRWWITFVGFAAVCALIAALIAPKSNVGFKDAASVLTFAGLIAVGIERILEFVWTLIGQDKGKGGWWPLNLVAEQAQAVETETNKLVSTIFDQVETGLTAAKAEFANDEAKLDVIEQHIKKLPTVQNELKARLTAAQKLAPGSARVEMAAGAATRASQFLGAATAVASTTTAAAQDALESASSAASVALGLVKSFGDNPARRISSMLLGAGAGMLVAGFIGLNVFAAIFDASAGALAGAAGIVLTGLLVGLGSNPTHEVIKALQAVKESQNKITIPGVPSVAESTAVPQAIVPFGFNQPAAAAFGAEAPELKLRTTD